MKTLIAIDACLVLAGAVLTSYVGVGGLVHRMTLDQCFPQFLLKSNRWHSYPYIILGFMALCLSILYLTKGDILLLGGCLCHFLPGGHDRLCHRQHALEIKPPRS